MEDAADVGSITTAMVGGRARELAPSNGHSATPTETDYQQAKRELTGEEEIDPKKMPRVGAKARRFSKKAFVKRRTIKWFGQPR